MRINRARARTLSGGCSLIALVAASVMAGGGTAHAEAQLVGEPVVALDAVMHPPAQAAYDASRDRFFVVTATPGSSGQGSFATGLAGAGGAAIPGTTQQVTFNHGYNPNGQPTAAYNPTTDEYMVLWTQGTGGLWDTGAHNGVMYGARFAGATGELVAGPFVVLDPPGSYFCEVRRTEIAYNPANGGYLISYNYAFFTTSGNAAEVPAGCPGVTSDARHQLRVSLLNGAGTIGSTVTVPGTGRQSDVSSAIARHPATGEFLVVANGTMADGTRADFTLAQRISPTGALVGEMIHVDDRTAPPTAVAADPVTGNWMVVSYTSDHGRSTRAHRFAPDGARVGDEVATGAAWGATGLVAIGDGTFLLRDNAVGSSQLIHLGPTGAPIGRAASAGGDGLVAGAPGAPMLVIGGLSGTGSAVGAQRVTVGPGDPIAGGGVVAARGRVCFAVAGAPGDLALVNLTPVGATAAGHGQLLSSDVAEPPVASNVNYQPGGTDPNVAAAPIGADGEVCFVNGPTATVHLVADHLLSIRSDVVTLAQPSGAALRIADTRTGLGGARLTPSARMCLAVAGAPGDVALVNLTPVAAAGAGNGQLVSSDVAQPPRASNVNFGPGTADPNVAAAPIGADGKVCFVNSQHTSVDLVADHLATVDGAAVTLAAAGGAPKRVADTREGLGGTAPGPNARVCVAVAGPAGGAALVNLTPVGAAAPGNGQLVSSSITEPPTASNVNFGPGTVDPNVAAAPIGADWRVCYVNSRHTQVQLVADHLATLTPESVTLATPTGAPARRVDTR